MAEFVVVFLSDVDVPIEERLFETKDGAKTYKAEHEDGKFAAVLPLRGTFAEFA